MFGKLIPFIFMAFFLTGCVGVKSFEGKIHSIHDDAIEVDCSQEVNKSKDTEREEIGYACQVQITKETKFSTENGDSISIEDLTKDASIRVILEDSQIISKRPETRSDMAAKETILLID